MYVVLCSQDPGRIKGRRSLTAHGSDLNFLPSVLSGLSSLPSSKSDEVSATVFEESLSKSFLVLAYMAHAVHPNYQIKYEDKHKPRLNEGVVLKVPLHPNPTQPQFFLKID